MTSTPDSGGSTVPTTDAPPSAGQSPQDGVEGRLIATESRRGDWMQVYSGRQFWPLDPRIEEIHIEDIAHALSMICRYNGHVNQFYSVAEHSILVSSFVSPENKLWALLHDAAEAYIGDMVRPLKRNQPAFQAAEDQILIAIAECFDLPGEGVIPEEVCDADTRILLDERKVLLAAPPASWGIEGLEPLGVDIFCISPGQAEATFLRTFYELIGDSYE